MNKLIKFIKELFTFTRCPKCGRIAIHICTIGHCVEEYECPHCYYYFMKKQ